MDLGGQYVVGWDQVAVNPHIFRDVLVRQYNADATPMADAQLLSADHCNPQGHILNQFTSIALSFDGQADLTREWILA